MRRPLLAVVLVVVLAGCAAPVAVSDDGGPSEGELGVVDGISSDEDLDISVDDGLTEEELDLLAARSMARIEVIRGLEFEERADIEIWTREEYQEWRGEPNASQVRTQWENQVWEAKFIVGQDRDVTQVFDDTLGDAVGGFYSPSSELVVIVTDSDTAAVSKRTLVHELVHVLQDQQFGIDSPPARQDLAMARDGVVEGEAELIPDLYFERCESEWSCLEPPSSAGEGADIDPGIILVLLHPYEQGPVFVDAIRERAGWDAVDDMYDSYPESTAQVIDPDKYPDTSPINVTVEDRSSTEWSPVTHDPPRETVGQAAIYVMLWHNDVIAVDNPFSYEHSASDGWAGDELVPYTDEANETGYVWEIAWESVEDAEQFHDAYHDVLAEQGAMERGSRQFVIPDGAYEGAYDVSLDGTTVTIVNGPTMDALPEIHAMDD